MKFLLLLLLFCNSLLANQTIIELSKEEKEYLKNKPTIKICSIIDLKPIEFYENNQFQGINIDLINLISKKLNIKFENLRVSNFEIAQEYMKNQTCDLLPTTIQNKNLNDLVDYTIPLFNYKLAIITQKNKPIVQDIEELINKTMAKKSSSETINLLKSNYPNIDIFETKSDYETFEAVNNNTVYYAIEPLPVVTYYMSKYALNNIFISKYTDISLTTKIAVLKNNQILFNILNKTIEKIKDDEHTNIFNKWTNFSVKEPFKYETISKILIGIFIILAILSYRQIILNKHNKALKLANNEIEEKNRLIAKQKELFEKLYNKSADGVLLIKNRKIIDCNEASSKILQYSKEELIDKFLSDISPKFQPDNQISSIKEIENIDEALKNGICNFEWVHTNENLEKLWIEVVLTSIEIESKSVIHMVIRDINQRKKMEKELETLTYKLEERINQEIKKNEEKTAQLITQSRLAQMGEMISMIAHQWRQPLTAISATTNNLLLKILLEQQMSNDELKNELQLITDYSQHLSLTIDDFRNFFKTDKLKNEVGIKNIIEKSINIIKTSFQSKNIQLKTNYLFDENIITYDTEIQQVLLVILKNAEDALIENNIGNKKVFIETLKNDNFVVIKIEDNAGGISSKIIDKIFDPYFSTKKQKEGTGIGLYMSKIIIHEHCNGTLKVKNTSFGASFEIKIPLSI